MVGSLTNESGGTIFGNTGAGIRINSSNVAGAIDNSGMIFSTTNIGIHIQNGGMAGSLTNESGGTISGNYGIDLSSSGSISGGINNGGNITGTLAGIRIQSGGTIDNIINQSGGTISGNNYGINVSGRMSGTIDNSGLISGNTGAGIFVSNSMIGGITNGSGATIQGTGGTAISLHGLTGLTPIVINGGSIIGDVTDNAPGVGFSPVTVAGNFTSQGNFTVSDFTVSSGATFILGAGDTISSTNAVVDNGTISVPGAESGITGGLTIDNGGVLNVADDFGVTGVLKNQGAITIATNHVLTAGTMGAAVSDGTITFGVTSAGDQRDRRGGKQCHTVLHADQHEDDEAV
jgi:hypothetical protein